MSLFPGAVTAPAISPYAQPEVLCPVCMDFAAHRILETFYGYTLRECSGCRLQFWNPRKMPDVRWYSAMYGERNSRVLPLEPGHRFFLADMLAPRCGTGNFVRAAWDAGYYASGVELDPAAASFAASYCPRARIFALPLETFRSQYPNDVFDVVTFFEVLEHQAEPNEFLAEIRACLRPRGFIALSVPNRERWQTSMDALDYPPNHFLRWNSTSLQNALRAHGFSVLSIKKEKPPLAHTVQQINNKLSSGISRSLAPELPHCFRDEIQEDPEEKAKRNHVRPSLRTRAVQMLGRANTGLVFR